MTRNETKSRYGIRVGLPLMFCLMSLSATAAWGQEPNILWMRGGFAGGGITAWYTAGGQTIFATGGDGTMKFFRASDGMLLKTLIPFSYLIEDLVLSPDGKYLAVSGEDGSATGPISVKVYSVPDANLVYTIPINGAGHNDIPGGLAFSPDDSELALYATAGVLPVCCPTPSPYTYAGIFTLATGAFQAITTTQNGQPVGLNAAPMFFSPDGSYLNMILVENDASPDDLLVVPVSSEPVAYWDYGPNSAGDVYPVLGNASYYVAASYNTLPWPDIWVYPVGWGCPVPKGSCNYPTPLLAIDTSGRPVSVAWSPDGTKIAAGLLTSNSYPVASADVYDFTSGSLLGTYPMDGSNDASGSVSFSADSQSLVTTDLLIHVLSGNNASWSFDVSNNSGSLTTAGFSLSGTETVSAPSNGADDAVAVRNISDGSLVNLIHVGQGISPLNVAGAALSSDGKMLAASVGWSIYTGGNSTALFDVASGALTSTVNTCLGQLAFLPDGQTLASACPSGNASLSTINFYNYQSQPPALIGSIASTSGPFSITPDGSRIAAYDRAQSGAGVNISTVPGGTQVGFVPSQPSSAVAISPDGSKVAIAANVNPSTLQLYSISGTLLFSLTGNTGVVQALAFSPDGHTLAAGDRNALLCIYEVATGQLLQTYTEETGVLPYGVESLSYSPDGTTIYWGRSDASSVLAQNPYYQPFLTALSAPAAIIGGDKAKGTVTLSANAPTGGLAVDLTATGVSVPATVTVPAGSSSATFAVSTTSVTSNQTATITATTGGVPKTATIAVEPLLVKSIALGAKTVTGGASISGNEVKMNGAAPEAAQVTLSSSRPHVASVPASVTVAKGSASSPAFTITTSAVTARTVVEVTATYNGVATTAKVVVEP